jgi:hypothetical protein
MEVFGTAEESNSSQTSRVQPTDKRPSRKKPSRPAADQASSTQHKNTEDNGLPAINDIDGWLTVFEAEKPDAPRPTDPAPQRSEPSKQGRYGRKDRRDPTVHKNMSTSDEVFLSEGEVDAWMDFFDADPEDDDNS